MVFVKYFVPEDGDEAAHPNVFKVQGCANVASLTLGLLRRAFPVDGTYHFRFLTTVPGVKEKVWMDLTEDGDVVPHSESGEVFAKVSRIGVQHYNTHQAPSSSSAENRRAPSQKSPNSVDTHTRRDSFGKPSDSGSGSGVAGTGTGKERRNSERLISFSDDNTPTLSKSPVHSAGGEEGLLDFGVDSDFPDVPVGPSTPAGGSHNDLFSLSAASISASVQLSPAPANSVGGSTMHNPMGAMFGASSGLQPVPMAPRPMGGGGLGKPIPIPMQQGQGQGQGQASAFQNMGGIAGNKAGGMGAGMGGGVGMGMGMGMSAMPGLNQMQQMQQRQNSNNKNAFNGLAGFK